MGRPMLPGQSSTSSKLTLAALDARHAHRVPRRPPPLGRAAGIEDLKAVVPALVQRHVRVPEDERLGAARRSAPACARAGRCAGPASCSIAMRAPPASTTRSAGSSSPQLGAVDVAVHADERRADRLELAQHAAVEKSPACSSRSAAAIRRDALVREPAGTARQVGVGDDRDQHRRSTDHGAACPPGLGALRLPAACARLRWCRSSRTRPPSSTSRSPRPGPGELLVDGLALGVCGTDREIAAGEYGWAPPGRERLVIGHESLGRVREAPAGSGFEAGDLVVGVVRRPDPVPCGACARGEFDMCRNGRLHRARHQGDRRLRRPSAGPSSPTTP